MSLAKLANLCNLLVMVFCLFSFGLIIMLRSNSTS